MATRYPDRAIGTVAGVTIIESHDPQASTYAEHMETITDPAEIRATDEPDPFRRNPVHRTGPDDPWRFTRFVADDHECVIVRDEYDEPAPFGSCSTHRRALSSPVALGCATPAPVGAAVGLNLDAARAMLNAANTIKATGGAVEIGGVRIEPCDEYGSTVTTARAESAEAEVGTLRDTLARRTDSHTQLVRENETLRAKVAAVEALADQWADRKRSDGMSGNAWIGITLAGVAADLRAALATTGEGQ